MTSLLGFNKYYDHNLFLISSLKKIKSVVMMVMILEIMSSISDSFGDLLSDSMQQKKGQAEAHPF
jgi:hypothetical protein